MGIFKGGIILMPKWEIPIRTAEYVLIGSDYSQQEPKILAFVIQDPQMIKAFSEGKDIYATIAGLAFNQPYEKCLEFHPETHEYQPDGKRMRGEAKTIVLGRPKGFVVFGLKHVPHQKKPSTRLLVANFVNLITQGCISYV